MMNYSNLGRVLTIQRKKNEILGAVSDVRVDKVAKKIIGHSGKVSRTTIHMMVYDGMMVSNNVENRISKFHYRFCIL